MARHAGKSPTQASGDPAPLEDWLVAEAHAERIISRPRKPGSAETPEPELQQSGGRSPIRDEAMKRILKQHPQRDAPKV
jgi:hypothetical protein